MARWRKYTFEILSEAVENSTSVAGVLRHLGLRPNGGSHAHISRTIKRFDIDTSHFVRHRNGAARARLSADQILCRRPPGSARVKPPLLRRALAEIGRPHECELCLNPGVWNGMPLGLEVDHRDGDCTNNEPGNVRFLCPNCHSQTATFAGRSRGKYLHVLPMPGVGPEPP